MKFLTFDHQANTARLGALDPNNGHVIDLLAGAEELKLASESQVYFQSMLNLIEGGSDALEMASDVVEVAGKGGKNWGEINQTTIKWRSPFITPPQLRDCLMFEEHLHNAFSMLRKTLAEESDDPVAALQEIEEKGIFQIPKVWYELPIYYKVNRFSFIGHMEDIVWPYYSKKLDFELEYACILNKTVKDISVEDANNCIFGYTIYNDVSARDTQSIEMQGQLGPSKGKDFDTGNILGPVIVTADEVDPRNLTMIARINGEQLCKGNSGDARWSFPEVISHVSRSETLVAGELIGSGTVGWGSGLEHGRFLKPGDTIELEVEGIGILKNTVVAP